MPEYSKEELWSLYEELPDNLKSLMFSVKTAEAIEQIGQRYKIDQEKTSEIAKRVGYVLLGLLPPSELEDNLIKELKLKPEIAKKISQELNRFVFASVKETLKELYRLEKTEKKEEKKEEEEEKEEEKEKEEISPVPSRKDIYREPIE